MKEERITALELRTPKIARRKETTQPNAALPQPLRIQIGARDTKVQGREIAQDHECSIELCS
jgi:hypothetical protein